MAETETTETAETPEQTVDLEALRAEINDLGKLVLGTLEEQIAEYNSRQATLDAVTGDTSKAVHELRNSSDDDEVKKFRAWLEKVDAQREAAVTKIDKYISENLLPKADMSEEQIEAEKSALKDLRGEIKAGETYFLALPGVKPLGENAALLVPKVAGARKSVAKGTGTGGPKPRVTGVYVDGELQSHDVDGKQKSTFTDAVKFLSEKHKTKVETKDIHAAWFAAANVTPEDWASAPDKTEFVFSVTDKDGKSHNHNFLITK